MSDAINPAHYKTPQGLEAIEVIERYGFVLNLYLGTALKYLLRAGRKGDAKTDFAKAKWYCQRCLDHGTDLDVTADEDALDWLPPEAVAEEFGLDGAHADAVVTLLSLAAYESEDTLSDGVCEVIACINLCLEQEEATP